MPKKRIIAWDSCIIIDAVQRHPVKYAHIGQMINDAETDKTTIVVSTVSLAEVRYCKEFAAAGMPQAEQDELISRWFDNAYIYKRVADRGVCELAAKLGREHHQYLTPLDAIVLATAVDAEADTLFTYDNNPKKDGGLLALDGTIGNLRIRLPEHYAGQQSLVFEDEQRN